MPQVGPFLGRFGRVARFEGEAFENTGDRLNVSTWAYPEPFGREMKCHPHRRSFFVKADSKGVAGGFGVRTDSKGLTQIVSTFER